MPSKLIQSGGYLFPHPCSSQSQISSTGSTPTEPTSLLRMFTLLFCDLDADHQHWRLARRVRADAGSPAIFIQQGAQVCSCATRKALQFCSWYVHCPFPVPRLTKAGEHFRCSWHLPPLLVDQATKEPVVRTHVHVPIPGEPAYGGQGGSGWTTPLLRPEDGGRTQSETRHVFSQQFTQIRTWLTTSSSLRSNSSKKIPPLSLPSASKKKSNENVGVNRAIPGPGDEVEADPEAGVLDSEKVTVVFLVSLIRRPRFDAG